MTSKQPARLAWMALPVVLVPAAFLAAAPSLKTAIGGTMTMLVAAAAAISVMGYTLYLSIRGQRCQDEVQAAGGQFAARWGLSIGPVVFASLLLLPPFIDMAATLIGDAAGVAAADRKVVLLAIMFGFGGVVILQSVAMVIIKLLWWRARR